MVFISKDEVYKIAKVVAIEQNERKVEQELNKLQNLVLAAANDGQFRLYDPFVGLESDVIKKMKLKLFEVGYEYFAGTNSVSPYLSWS